LCSARKTTSPSPESNTILQSCRRPLGASWHKARRVVAAAGFSRRQADSWASPPLSYSERAAVRKSAHAFGCIKRLSAPPEAADRSALRRPMERAPTSAGPLDEGPSGFASGRVGTSRAATPCRNQFESFAEASYRRGRWRRASWVGGDGCGFATGTGDSARHERHG
jgi:hypothetical protein